MNQGRACEGGRSAQPRVEGKQDEAVPHQLRRRLSMRLRKRGKILPKRKAVCAEQGIT